MADLYKSNKDQVSVFGFRTQYGGGKSTGFALVYDSSEALKKFEPHYRLVRIGAANKIEKASRQQRTYSSSSLRLSIANYDGVCILANPPSLYRQATEEPFQEVPRYRQGQGPQEEQGLNASSVTIRTIQYGPMMRHGAMGKIMAVTALALEFPTWLWLVWTQVRSVVCGGSGLSSFSANIRLKPKMMPVEW